MAESRSINRKLTAVTKGKREGSHNRIEMAQHKWYLSEQTNDLLHHEDGNFAAHPKVDDGHYYAHHSHKVLPKDAEPVEMTKDKKMWTTVFFSLYFVMSSLRLSAHCHNAL